MEYWDLYNENREKIGKPHKRGEPIPKGTYHLAVNVWILNSKGKVLLTQRHPEKMYYGGLWECSASGSVISGEDTLQGALREVWEEIGVILSPKDAILLESARKQYYFRDTYLFIKDIPLDELKLQAEEVIGANWVTRDEYEGMRDRGLMVPLVIDFWEMYSQWKDGGSESVK